MKKITVAFATSLLTPVLLISMAHAQERYPQRTLLVTESATGTVLHAAVGAAQDDFQQPEQ